MKPFTIVWDFDGTILPLKPFDSEQTLLLYSSSQMKGTFALLKKIYARLLIYADRGEWFRKKFKTAYAELITGTTASVLDKVCFQLAGTISADDRRLYRELKSDGHEMLVVSCGTFDLIERVLTFAGIRELFSFIAGNRLRFAQDRIQGMDLDVPDPEDKLRILNQLNLRPKRTVVVGDGYTDLPILDWSDIPILIDRTGMKRKRYCMKPYYFISSISEITNIIKEKNAQNEQNTKK
jgi:phosphoserine phosphatase